MHHSGVRLPRLAGRAPGRRLHRRGRIQGLPAKLAQFREQEGLTFTLVSDEDRAIQEAYGAWGLKKLYGKEVEGSIRSTVVIDESGKVALAQYNVKATGHVAKLRRDLGID
ncbi:hypothetical protein GCM10025873_14930 [Demequina sediminis]|nr:hypothetical protein GCM10025873_14930 [Demequina sediminis]